MCGARTASCLKKAPKEAGSELSRAQICGRWGCISPVGTEAQSMGSEPPKICTGRSKALSE